MAIELATGDLLAAPVEGLVNPVNTAGVMGKGLALEFKRRFPDVFAAYAAAHEQGGLRVGRVHVVHRDESPRYVFNLTTKKHWRGRSRLEYIRLGVEDLALQVRRLEVRTLAVPALGCGLGQLTWADVEPLITSALEPLSDVRVLLFPPR